MEAWMAALPLAPLLGLPGARDDDPSLRQAEVLDRSLHFRPWHWRKRTLTGSSLSLSPGKQLQLWQNGLRKSARLANHLVRCMGQFGHRAEPCICPLPQDKRFSAPDWQDRPTRP
jgi:hypothetical protein